MPLGVPFLLIGAFLLMSEPTQSAVKCRKHFHNHQKSETARANQKLLSLSDQFAPFDYDYPDYSSGVFVDAIPISRTTKRAQSLIGQEKRVTKMGNSNRNRPPPMGKVRKFGGENARRAEWYETLFTTRKK